MGELLHAIFELFLFILSLVGVLIGLIIVVGLHFLIDVQEVHDWRALGGRGPAIFDLGATSVLASAVDEDRARRVHHPLRLLLLILSLSVLELILVG